MIIIWALFDLQVIAYRLFHAEWNPLDAGMDSPENMTLESLEKIAKELTDMAAQATATFRSGGGVDEADPRLRVLIERHDLLANASRAADRLGINEETLRTSAFEPKDLVRYLRYLQQRLNRWLKVFQKSGFRPRYTLVGYAHHAAGTSKGRYKAKSLGIKQSVATVRFSVPAITALLYAVEGVVEQLGMLPSRGKFGDLATDSPRGSKPLFGKQQRSKITAALFTVYRDLFVRPVKNARDEIVTSEYNRDFAEKAEAAISDGKPDPGLEPLLPDWRKRPVKPLYGGTPARRLLAQGVDYGAGNRDPQDPAVWVPKRVASERKTETDVARALRANPQARCHFRTQADRLEADFGGGFGKRLSTPQDHPPQR